MQKLAQVREGVEPILNLQKRAADLSDLIEMVMEEGGEDESLETELSSEAIRLTEELARFELENLLSGEHDHHNAIVEINSGAGGTEACDWAEMLLRMYLRWAQSRNFTVEMADEVPGEVVGFKNVTFVVRGRNAYGYLKAERGVHRMVRLSPYNANNKRQTTFASIDVIPEVEEAEEIAINPDDLRVDTYRSSGAGGQHVNKTDSAVRITHLPTNIVVTCQNERSQQKNRSMAMKVLQSRLLEREIRAQEARMAAIRGEQLSNEWGSQIRSYVFDDRRVKDHRTGHETADVLGVMDGDIDPFLQAYLQWQGRKT